MGKCKRLVAVGATGHREVSGAHTRVHQKEESRRHTG
jgi:hypothetical protein